MLKKLNRLGKSREIAAAFARGRSFFSPFFSIKFLAGTAAPRFTVVVSTKVFKNAVARNRLKRILREYLRLNLKKFKNGNYIVMVKPKINKLPEREVLKNFQNICLKFKQV